MQLWHHHKCRGQRTSGVCVCVCESYMHLTLICASTVGSQASSEALASPAYPHFGSQDLPGLTGLLHFHFSLLQLSAAKFHLQFSSAAVAGLYGVQAQNTEISFRWGWGKMELEKQAKFVIEMPGVPHALTQNLILMRARIWLIWMKNDLWLGIQWSLRKGPGGCLLRN